MGSRLLIIVVCLSARVAFAQAIERVEVRGTQRVDADAVMLQIGSKRGRELDHAQVREDIRAIWQLGTFSDVGVVTEERAGGGVTLAFEVKERPVIRKVLIAGNHELKLDKIDDVLTLKLGTAIDISKVRKNRDEIEALYLQSGFLLAGVSHELVAVGADQVDVKFVIDEHEKVRVQDIQLVGNSVIPDDELRDLLVTRRPNALSFMNDSGLYRRDALDRDIAVIAGHYYDRGFPTVKIETPQLRLSRDRRFMHVTITIDEGPQFSFGTLAFKGDLIGTPADHLARIKSRSGATFSRSQVDRDRKVIETYYQDQGYAQVNVVPRMRLDAPSKRVELAFEIVRGKRVYVERIHVRGNSKTRDKVIRRELKISEGELYSGTSLEASRRRVMMLGFFENVTVSSSKGSSDEFVDINVEVRERRTGTFQIGAGFSSVESFIVQGQIQYDNLFGRGQSLAFQAQISGLRRMFTFRFVEPAFLDTRWLFATELYNQSRGLGAYSRNATGGALTWGHPLGDHASASLTYRLETVGISSGSGGIANLGARTTTLSSIDTANLFRGGVTSSVRGALSWDSRNNRLLPSDGWHSTAFAEYAGRITGSENQFVRWGGFVRNYRHLGGPFTLRLNAELGVTTSLDGRGVPLTERYMLGGIYDIRGYQPRSLGPSLYTQRPGDPGQELDPLTLGGNMQVIGNAEIEFPLLKKMGLSGVVFFDIGNAFNLEDRFCNRSVASIDACTSPTDFLGGMRKSVGVGVRWLSPIGPLRFEWGIPLDLKRGEKGAGLDFTIGTSF